MAQHVVARTRVHALLVLALVGALLVATPLPASAAVPAPAASLDVPPAVFLGEEFSLGVTFDNTASTAAGYGPYLDLVVPVQGADGDPLADPLEPPDGLTFVSATYLGVPVTVTEVVLACDGTDVHPYTGAVVDCADLPGTGSGDLLAVLELPFGSFTPTQPPATVDVTLALSELADLDVALVVSALAGFRYGADPLDNPQVDPPLVQAVPTSAAVVPTLATLDKTYLGPEDETATGPNFPRRWLVELSVAPGQELTGVVLTDYLPDNVAFLSAAVTAGSGTVTSAPPAGTPQTDGVVEVTFAQVIGTGGVSAAFEVEFFVPAFDAVAAPVLDPDTGAPALSRNDATATGSWDPIDDRDPPALVEIDDPGPEHVLTDRSLAIQKTVTIADDTGPVGASPGDTLEWTLEFQVSDFFTFEALHIVDVLTDGQRLDPAFPPTLTVDDASGSGTVPDLTGHLEVTVDGQPGCADDGRITLELDLSGAVAEAVPASGGALTGGLVDAPDSGPTAGTVTFRTVIDDSYRCLDDGLALDSLDTIGNTVEISGDVVRDGIVTGHRVTDGSAAGVVIVEPQLSKVVYARNGDVGDTGPQFAAGDTITYRLTAGLPIGNHEGLVLDDYLPLPTLDAGELTTFDFAQGPSPAPPPAGTVTYGPDETRASVAGGPGADPGVTVDAVGNSVTFAFPDIQEEDPPGTLTVDLLFTVTLSDTPFADGLFLTNQLRMTYADSFESVAVGDEIIQFELTNPQPAVHKGVVATDGVGTFEPSATGPGGPWTLGGTPRFAGAVTSTGLEATPLASDLTGAWAGDRVAFAVVVENTGSGLHGAFDVVVTDTLPDGMAVPVGGLDLEVTDGTGAPLGHTELPGGLFGDGVQLTDDAGSGTGALAPFDDTSGQNLAVLTYVLELVDASAMGQVATNTATVVNFAAAPGGPSYPEVSAQASVTVALPEPAKDVVGTSAPHTSGLDVAIGETVTYEATVAVPPSQTPDTVLRDTLPVGMAFVSFDGLAASDASLTSSEGTFAAILAGIDSGNVSSVDGQPGRRVDVPLGTLTNASDTVQTLTFTYTAAVTNVTANQDTVLPAERRNRVVVLSGAGQLGEDARAGRADRRAGPDGQQDRRPGGRRRR